MSSPVDVFRSRTQVLPRSWLFKPNKQSLGGGCTMNNIPARRLLLADDMHKCIFQGFWVTHSEIGQKWYTVHFLPLLLRVRVYTGEEHVPRRTKSLEGGPSSGPRRRSATIQGKRSSWWRQIGHTRTSWLILLCLIWDVCGWSCGFGLGCRELVLYLDGFQPCVQDELSRVIYGGH